MKAFKYLIFFFFLVTSKTYSADIWHVTRVSSSYVNNPDVVANLTASSPQALCTAIFGYNNGGQYFQDFSPTSDKSGYCYTSSPGGNRRAAHMIGIKEIICPSATEKRFENISPNSPSYVCQAGCQFKLTKCVSVDFESPNGSMICSAISTGLKCGVLPPPDDNPNSPDEDPNFKPPENTANTTTNEDGTTDTKFNLESLEKLITNMTSVIADKLDKIISNTSKDGSSTGGNGEGNNDSNVTVDVELDLGETNQKIEDGNSILDEIKDWLQGSGEESNNPFGDDQAPSKDLEKHNFETDIFNSSSNCPPPKKLSFRLFERGPSFTYEFEFDLLCSKLEIFGNLFLIFSYLFGAYIIVSKS